MKHLFKALFLLLALFLPAIATAHDFEVDGIYYDINGKEAIVTSSPSSNEYTGDVTIPTTVTYSDITYSVTEIGDCAFSGCSELTSVNIPNSVVYIGIDAFYYCTSLTSVTIGNSVTGIGYRAFEGCSGLTSITIPNSVTSIGGEAFAVCSGLTSITIGNSVSAIGDNAFASCRSLSSISIPRSVAEIGFYAFVNCSGLNNIIVESGNPKYDSRNNCNAIIETATNTLIAGCKNTTIPNSVTEIGLSAFCGCSSLISITIPNSVTEIDPGAFDGCTGLSNITIPNSVTFIDSQAFDGCTGLTDVTIGNSVTVIEEYAFRGCSGLTNVTCFAIQPPNFYPDAYDVFDTSVYQTATIYVPYSAIAAYSNAEGWKNFQNIVSFNEDVFEIDGIYYRITSDTTVEVASHISNYSGSNDEVNLVIPSNISYNNVTYSVTAIADSAFYGNQKIKDISLPETISSIGVAAFKNCPNLKFLNCLGMAPPTINNSFDSHEKLGLFEVFNVPEYAYSSDNNEINNDVNGLVLFVPYEAYTFYKSEFQDSDYFSYITSHEVTAEPDYSEIFNYDDRFGINMGFYLLNDYFLLPQKNQNLLSSFSIDIHPTEESTVYTRVYSDYYDYGWGAGDYPSVSFGVTSYCKDTWRSLHFFAIAEGKMPSRVLSTDYYFSHIYARTHEESGVFYLETSNRTIQVTFGALYSFCTSEGENNFAEEIISYSGDIAIPSDVRGYTVTEIGNRAFAGCVNLTSVTLPATIKSIGAFNVYDEDFEFYNDFDDDSICFSNCPNLAKITCLATNPPTASINSFDDNVYQNTTFYVPYSALEAYRNAPGWCNFQNIVGFYDFEVDGVYYSITSDNELIVARSEEAYQGVIIVPSMVTYDGVTYNVTGIGYDAFANANLTHLVLPVTISTIAPTAFTDCHIGSLVVTGNGTWTAGALAADVDQLFVMSSVTGIPGLQVNPATIYSYSTVPPTCNGQTFTGYDGELHVPASSLASYFTAPYWTNFINITGDAVEPLAVTLNKDSVSLLIGNQLTLTAVPAPANTTPGIIIWSSSDKQVATVNNGEITAVGVGECDIKAILLDKVATCHVTVTEIVPTELTLNQEFAKLEVGSQLTLTATIMPEDATDKVVTWTTTNAAVATVDGQGNVTAVGPGECTITATCRGLQATCHVVVVEHLIFITLDQHEANLLPNHILLLTPSVSPVSSDLVVTSSNPAVAAARMANGKIQVAGITEGVTTITVNSTDGYAEGDSCVVTVYTERGDLNMDGFVNMDDLTVLINYLLTNNPEGININNAADCDGHAGVSMDDLTALINHLLTNQWPNPVDPDEPVEPEGTQSITVNGVSFKMVPVESGTFMMGATAEQGDDAYNDEKPVHEVTLSSFYIGQTEVTQALWQAVMGSNPSYFPDDPNRPVEMVSWNDCQAFITQLNQMTGKQFRMPTEAEWEYAARGGNKSQGYKYSGSNDIDEVCWYEENSDAMSHVVGTKAPNELGLYDMTGNVWEWVQDWYARYSAEAQIDPTGPETGTQRVFRGGSWYSSARLGRVSYRDVENMTNSYNRLGLRLVLDNPEI